MKYCAWCKRIENVKNKTWDNIPAEIPINADDGICPECKDKMLNEHYKNRGKKERCNI